MEKMTNTIEPMLPEKNLEQFSKKSTSKVGQFLATISVCMGALIAGTTLSWSSPCLEELLDQNSTAPIFITEEQASWVGSLLPVGALFAAIPAGICADKFGRKNSILGTTVPFFFGFILLIKASTVWMLYLGRILSGFGVGAVCVLSPMYITEITEEKIRGSLCSFFPLFFCIGITLIFIIALFAKFVMLTAILAIIPIIYGVSFMFMPESPIYLLKIGRESEARKSLKFLRGKFAEISAEISNIKKNIEAVPEEKAKLADLFRNRYYLKCLIACVTLFFFLQFSGINAVIFYTVPIFKASRSTLDPIASSILVSVVQIVVITLVIFIVNKQGRIAYIVQTNIVCTISLVCLGIAFQLIENDVTFSGLNLIPLICLMVYIFSFCIGLGSLPWLIVGELLSPEIIGIVNGIGVMINWFSAFIVTRSFGPMMTLLGSYNTFYIYAFLNGLGALCIYFLVPETRARSYLEIQKNWNRK